MKKTVIAVLLLVILTASFVLIWHFKNPARNTEAGSKTITVTVYHGDGSEKDFTIKTDEEFLRGALRQEKLIEGTDGEFGIFVTSVDGESVKTGTEQWWNFCDKDGKMLSTGIDSVPISDGDMFKIILEDSYDAFG